MVKKKTVKKIKPLTVRARAKTTKARARSTDASGGTDRASARKWRRGGRIEAYTWGEVYGKGSNWPF